MVITVYYAQDHYPRHQHSHFHHHQIVTFMIINTALKMTLSVLTMIKLFCSEVFYKMGYVLYIKGIV